jgi:fructuronate reductase
MAVLQQTLLEKGHADTGIIAAESYDGEIIEKIYRPYDDLFLLVVMKADGTYERKVMASVAKSLDAACGGGRAELKKIFENPSLQVASFTITEKGYGLRALNGEYFEPVKEDIENGPGEAPGTLMALVAGLLYGRFQKNAAPIALLSLDNCARNGEKLFAAVDEITASWAEKGLADKAFPSYVRDGKKVGFPLSMIDKITPAPSAIIKGLLEKDGLTGMDILQTARRTSIAPFVNTEAAQYLVIEDAFPNGRMPLEKAGVYFTDRKTVDLVERMKVCVCVNPLHTALAVFGCLLKYESISSEMRDGLLRKLVERLGYREGLPVVVPQDIIDPCAFIREFIEERLPNPNVPDTPGRIASDTSQKMAVRFGETLKAYAETRKNEINDLVCIPLTIAGWCRYLMGRDDRWDPMTLSPDPMLSELEPLLAGIRLGEKQDVHAALKPILSNEKLFGVDLYKIGLGERVERYFLEMVTEKGAVRKTLEKHLG